MVQRVLIVEDDEDLRTVMREALIDRFECDVIEADSGVAALSRIDDGAAPDIIVTDFRMPEMDGLQLAQELRSRQIGVPIIFVTGVDARDLPAHVFALGSFDFVKKPMGEDFYECVANALGVSRMGWASAPSESPDTTGDKKKAS